MSSAGRHLAVADLLSSYGDRATTQRTEPEAGWASVTPSEPASSPTGIRHVLGFMRMESAPPEIRHGRVVLEDVTLAFREVGSHRGVPVVLLHALGSSAGTWDAFAARLAAHGRHVLA